MIPGRGTAVRYPDPLVATRQHEKEQRRQARLERERAEARAAARRKRVQLAVGALLAIGAVAAVAAFVVGGVGGGGGSDGDDGSEPRAIRENLPALPEQQTADMQDAAKAAGCTLANPSFEGADHENREFRPADYKTNPPTSGNHNPIWYDDGIYEPGTVPRLGMLVHTLEHGRINLQYKPGTPAADVLKLEALLAEQSEGYHMLLYENTTGMDAQVAATAWTHSLTCPRMNDEVFDAIRTFRARYIDKGPEAQP
jgi:hypothetical protein